MAEVKLEGVARRYKNTTAIEGISFVVPDGEFWVLVGPSGCGKSTILRAIAGLEPIAEGTLYIGDKRMNDIPARQRDVAMVFQNYALYPHMTVAENLAFGLKMRGENSEKIARQVESVARSLGLEPLLGRKPGQLSGGQQQRVALGRAIARQPQVFLLDEPLSNLDAKLRDGTRAELKQLHARLGITTLYVTHDQTEAMTLADRIVVLNGGRIQQIGSPQEIYSRPANRQVATFFGSPPTNVLPAIYRQGQFQCARANFPCPEAIQQQLQPADGQCFDLGLRPERIHLAAEASPETRIEAEVELIEPLGKETLIRAHLLDSAVAIDFFAPGTWGGRAGDRVKLAIEAEYLFVFDLKSGETLYCQGSEASV